LKHRTPGSHSEICKTPSRIRCQLHQPLRCVFCCERLENASEWVESMMMVQKVKNKKIGLLLGLTHIKDEDISGHSPTFALISAIMRNYTTSRGRPSQNYILQIHCHCKMWRNNQN